MIIEDLQIIDWYDDIITSIIQIDQRYYLSNCIKKNHKENEKTYYNVQIPNSIFKKIKIMITSKEIFTNRDWNYINIIFKKNNVKNNIIVFDTFLLEVGLNVFVNKQDDFEIKDIHFPFDAGLLYL